MRIRVVDSHDYLTQEEKHITANEVYGALREAKGPHKRLFISLDKGTTLERLDSTKGRKIYGPAWVHVSAFADGSIETVVR
ncbi:hypothetical protein [Streptomyces sp. NPDC018045]|uniref:hypothetical protein n=1 Tax=Streptomyces sp. NPDC018045 TaxID=3365037 RepID=UPI0037AA913E